MTGPGRPDDDWTVVDLGPAGDDDVLSSGSDPGSHRRRAVVAVVAVVAVTAVWAASARPSPLPPLTTAPVQGVSIRSLDPAPGDHRPGAVSATYRVDDLAYAVVGVTGAFDGPVSVSRVREGTGSVRRYVVTAVPRCTDPAALDTAARATHLVEVVRRYADGRTARGTPRASGSTLDWDAATRTGCWQWLSARLVHLDALAGVRNPRGAELVATLRSDLPRDSAVGVLDVADVATIDAPDSGVLRAGSRRTFRVRLPARSCASTRALAWAVGPVDADPQAVLTTTLSPTQLRAVREACSWTRGSGLPTVHP